MWISRETWPSPSRSNSPLDVTHILDGLNERQREAVTAPVGNLLVVAGAGSGKTRVLVHRIAWLVQAEGASPHSVLAVTFTNKAAAEMRSRTETLLDVSPRAMWVGTFHGIAHRLLRMHSEDAGLPQNFQIIDADDQAAPRAPHPAHPSISTSSGGRHARRAGSSMPRRTRAGVPRRWSPAKTISSSPTRRSTRPTRKSAAREASSTSANSLLRCHELWLERADILEHYRRRFAHILVDEFQDTNTIQYASLRVLAGSESSVMAVGDDDQSIYGWRGAKIENIHRYSQDFRDTRIVRLEQNYRSTGTILKAANGLIDNNIDRLGKELWTGVRRRRSDPRARCLQRGGGSAIRGGPCPGVDRRRRQRGRSRGAVSLQCPVAADGGGLPAGGHPLPDLRRPALPSSALRSRTHSPTCA